MNHDYNDITDRIKERPRWWDENAVPRYCTFAPRETANIYADECCLVLIHCQGCSTPFEVAFSSSQITRVSRAMEILSSPATNDELQDQMDALRLKSLIRERTLHYGDPPNYGCCAAGPTMNSVPVRVLEFWDRQNREWERYPALEVEIEPDWAEL